jgi:hypothetical protein
MEGSHFARRGKGIQGLIKKAFDYDAKLDAACATHQLAYLANPVEMAVGDIL